MKFCSMETTQNTGLFYANNKQSLDDNLKLLDIHVMVFFWVS